MRVSAVSYLNTWPLIWGFEHGPQRGRYELRYDLPAECAAALESGAADIGLVPSAELDRLGLDFLPDLGIACDGPVRSILLVSQVPLERIGTMAVDAGSRTSVALTRMILAERYECFPAMQAAEPELDRMLAQADAALIIGDAALRLDCAHLPEYTVDLGEAWVAWTGLPMVFAVWAGSAAALAEDARDAFIGSYRWGRSHMEEIVGKAVSERGFPQEMARRYLTRHIQYELAPEHREGLALFRSLVRRYAPLEPEPA